ncbi:hypothetical protein HCH_00422 [Hahella chejuensis KCTC 2396]|uniref:Uncharacterized protein n=1 Tax=Hahella chejuensis (strain KCTC 2396) TaxID=349521 RepID=Q2SPU2_HAHCH|nr:hypothetical protein [Hahella chejuensis]ABC27332.1 hypothetical protein HCH_00422 [Hahella chejuensis KCTC 2396]
MKMTNLLERKLIGVDPFWVVRIDYSPLTAKLCLDLTPEPESGIVTRRAIFSGVTTCKTDYFDAVGDADYMPTVIGVLSAQKGAQQKIVVTTDAFEMTFDCAGEPEIEV